MLGRRVRETRRERAEDRYVVQAEIASGGMGIVYRVKDRVTGEDRALKRMHAESASRLLLVEAFEREYQVLAGLDHPRIIRVFDYGVDENGPYYTMELVEGLDMRAAAPLSVPDACRYLRDVATSLSLLHARRLIHRDLSPTNVRITPEGRCKLLDFGALTAFGHSELIVGTPPAVPPEAIEHTPLDQRADLYSLGALAYWMLTRKHAFPAARIGDLPALWAEAPRPPSEFAPEIPPELDALVLSLLSLDPLARPGSAAEVIGRLTSIGELPSEDEGEAQRLALSFLLNPHFVGRSAELAELHAMTDAAAAGKGAAVRIEAIAGMGRTRLLEEAAVRAQLAGAKVLRVDANVYRQAHGTARALVVRLLDAFPELCRQKAPRYRAALSALGREVEARLPSFASVPPALMHRGLPEGAGTLDALFLEIAQEKPLFVAIDNVEYADAASIGLIAGLARLASGQPLLVAFTERRSRDQKNALGLATLRTHSKTIALDGMSAKETLALARSLFDDVPNLERFAEWLQGRAAGSPLHAIEISRQLVLKHVIRHVGGMWVLPFERPDAELPAALEDALSIRLDSLGKEARGLAECLSLPREQLTLRLCKTLLSDASERQLWQLLDELAANDVLHADKEDYRFSSVALREAILRGMSEPRREHNHKRLGEAFAKLAGPLDHSLKIEAGWHLIKGGDELRGAAMIAEVTHDSVTARTLTANLHRAGRPFEEALKVYKRHRRSIYERMPLLGALAQAGYYEDRIWGERYGDEALDALEEMTGLRTAQRLRPYVGRPIALFVGLVIAFARFFLAPSRERPYPFREIFVQLFGAVTTLTAVASLSLDMERAGRVTAILEPFQFLPERLTPVGIFQFCQALQEVGRGDQAVAYALFERLVERFENPRYYPSLTTEARRLYWAGAHFLRGSFATMKADGRAALESADVLDSSGLKLYAMIASQLRFLYYMNRGEAALAAPHREQVELHAAHVGSAWQVETWESQALTPLQTSLSDLVAITRTTNRLDVLRETVPSLKPYWRLARLAGQLVRRENLDQSRIETEDELRGRTPRSFIGEVPGWAFLARGYNQLGRYQEAHDVCARVIQALTAADREFVTLNLHVELEMAVTESSIGNASAGILRLDALAEHFATCDHPLVLGRIHEKRARLAWSAGRLADYEVSLAAVDRWFRPTGNPILIAKSERLAELRGRSNGVRRATTSGGADASSAQSRPSFPLVDTSADDAQREVKTVRIATRESA
jgi:hypothetical protein